jgi:hypothetical protein
MQPLTNELWVALGTFGLRLIGALLVLLVGWLVARFIANVVRKLLSKTNLDNRAVEMTSGEKVPSLEEGIARIIYYALMLLVLVGFFEVLGLELITEPLNNLLNTLLAFIPNLLAAAVLVVAAWLVATILRGLTRRILETANVDRRVSDQIEAEQTQLSKAFSEGVYWLVWLVFLTPILGALGLQSLVAPLTNMFNEALAYLPNLVAAAVILLVGWFVARIVQRLVTSFLDAVEVDKFGERIGLKRVMGEQSLANLLGLIVFILILLPVVIAALDALQLVSLTTPLTDMLGTILDAIPAIVGAFIIVAVAAIIGRLVGDLVANLLAGLGFDNVLVSIGISSATPSSRTTPSKVVGYIVLIAIILLALLSATSLLNFPALTDVITQFIAFAWNILIGLVIFGIGLWFAGLVSRGIEASNIPQKRLAALFARIAVIVFAASMALGQMGLASSIVNLAFGLTLGAVAVAVAIAFGLGGRDVAARELNSWVENLREDEDPGVLTPGTSDDTV